MAVEQDLIDAVAKLGDGAAYEAVRLTLTQCGSDATAEARLRVVLRVIHHWPSSVIADSYAGMRCRRECQKHGIEIVSAHEAREWLKR